MTDELRSRLAVAAESAREHEHLTARIGELRARHARQAGELTGLRVRLDAEQTDVDKLERISITRVLASVAGRREERLDRERAEAEAARLRVAEAEARLGAVRDEIAALLGRLNRLSDAPQAFRALMAETEAAVIAAGEPGGAELAATAAERGRITADLKETREALSAAQHAQSGLAFVTQYLDRAAGWSTYDTFFGGGMLASAAKHDRLDQAWHAAADAERRLAVLRTELADVGGMPPLSADLRVSSTSRMIDIWFDNVFTDMAIRNKIKNSQASVYEARQVVGAIEVRLADRARGQEARLAELDTARRAALLGE